MKDFSIINCAAKDLAEKANLDGNVDLIITDPPYLKETMASYSELGNLAMRILKHGASLFSHIGHAHLPEALDRLRDAGLTYEWTIALGGFNQTASCIGRRVYKIRWKPIVWFFKPPRPSKKPACPHYHYYLQDVIQGNGRDKKRHVWGQDTGNSQLLIERLPTGSLVCDPFIGGGTNAEASLACGMRFIGCDIDMECVRVSRQRIQTMQQEMFAKPSSLKEEVGLIKD